jgi:hypothetical protein
MSSVKLSEERFSQQTTVCPEGYLFGCDRYGCRCRKNVWETLSKGTKTGIIVGGVVGIIVIGLIFWLSVYLYNRKSTSSLKYPPKYGLGTGAS